MEELPIFMACRPGETRRILLLGKKGKSLMLGEVRGTSKGIEMEMGMVMVISKGGTTRGITITTETKLKECITVRCATTTTLGRIVRGNW